MTKVLDVVMMGKFISTASLALACRDDFQKSRLRCFGTHTIGSLWDFMLHNMRSGAMCGCIIECQPGLFYLRVQISVVRKKRARIETKQSTYHPATKDWVGMCTSERWSDPDNKIDGGFQP